MNALRAAWRTIRAALSKHRYLSTGCLHGQHAYCQNKTGQAGPKKPAQCKFCSAPCRCRCHTRQKHRSTP